MAVVILASPNTCGQSEKAKLVVTRHRGCQIARNCAPLFASKTDPSEGAETGGAEPHTAEQSRSWRAAIGEREVMRGS